MNDQTLKIRLSDEERADWDRAAKESHMSLSAWIRSACNNEASQRASVSVVRGDWDISVPFSSTNVKKEPPLLPVRPPVAPIVYHKSFKPDPKPTGKKKGR